MEIEDPLRHGVWTAVEDCHKAGVAVKMCTSDNVLIARLIATQCGIFMADGLITGMDGLVFRQLDGGSKTFLGFKFSLVHQTTRNFLLNNFASSVHFRHRRWYE